MQYSDLYTVDFIDQVSNVGNLETSDVLGIYLPVFYGPLGELVRYTRSTFLTKYPEFVPLNHQHSDFTAFESYSYPFAQVRQYFNNGGYYVEVYSPKVGQWEAATHQNHYVTFKYPNAPYLRTPSLSIVVTDTTIDLLSNGSSIEHFVGQFTNPDETRDGQSTYFPNVLQRSNYLQSFVIEGTSYQDLPINSTADTHVITALCSDVLNFSFYSSPDVFNSTILAEYESVFSDSSSSAATLLVPPALSPSSDSELNYALSSSASRAMTRIALISTPGALPTSAPRDKFTEFICGRERVIAFGDTLALDCCGGVAGAYSRIASSNNHNLLASARRLGTYSGALTSYLDFSTVYNYHEDGVTSVYIDVNGPSIFGIHNSSYPLHPSSVYSFLNVSRVLTHLLRQVFPILFDAIHTDAADNPESSASLLSKLNSAIYLFINNKSLKGSSFASILSSESTSGGRVLSIMLSLSFIGLAERIDFKIFCSDTSISVQY